MEMEELILNLKSRGKLEREFVRKLASGRHRGSGGGHDRKIGRRGGGGLGLPGSSTLCNVSV